MRALIFDTNTVFSAIYVLAFILTTIIVLTIAIKRKYDLRNVFLTMVSITVFSIIGSKLLTIPISDWQLIFNLDIGDTYNGRSALGALIFGLFALIICQHIFSFNKPIFDIYAWTAPLALGIQKVGCFFMGCCFGLPTNSFWGMHYEKGSYVHLHQWRSGMLTDVNAISAPVHPVQIYELFLLTGIAIIVWKSRDFWKKKFSVLLFSGALFAIFRFGIEFLRDPSSSQFMESYYFGVRLMQWVLLGAFLLFVVVLFINEKLLKPENNVTNIKKISATGYLIYIFCLFGIVLVFSGMFSSFESFVILVKLIPAAFLVLYFMKGKLRKPAYAFSIALLMLFPMAIIAQSITEKNNKKRFKEISVGSSFGSLDGSVILTGDLSTSSYGCGSSYESAHHDFKYSYSSGGLGFKQVVENIFGDRISYGANMYFGRIKETINGPYLDESNKHSFYGIKPFITYDTEWIGIGAGVHIGKLLYTIDEFKGDDEIKFANKKEVIPDGFIRLGRTDILDVKYAYGFIFPSPFPSATYNLSIGSGLSFKEFSLRYGIIKDPESKYLSAEGMLSENFGFNVFYGFDHDYWINGDDFNSGNTFMLGLKYRFDHKRTN